jgi:hypothetical protein
MALTVRIAECFYIRIEDAPEQAYELLAQLGKTGAPLTAPGRSEDGS